jgi:putative addiction module CopG family antidote
MKISLSPDVEHLIEERVRSGRYQSADEVVREGLALLKEREQNGQDPISKGSESLTELFASIAREVPEAEWKKVPTDLSKNLDHYLYDRRNDS